MSKNKIRIGSGAGFQSDRISPAVELAEKGDIQYLVFECLAERTIALAQQNRRKDPRLGYDALLEARMAAVLPSCCKKKIKIITNMGAANPVGGMHKIVEVAQKLGITGIKIAAVTGDDVLEIVLKGDYIVEETGDSVNALNQPVSRECLSRGRAHHRSIKGRCRRHNNWSCGRPRNVYGSIGL